jgi:hypothetical protein
MGMDFGDGPDFDAIREERTKANSKVKTESELTEEDIWRHLFFIQRYEATEDDDGLREICQNIQTGKLRMKKRDPEYKDSTSRNSVIRYKWIWDGEEYDEKKAL